MPKLTILYHRLKRKNQTDNSVFIEDSQVLSLKFKETAMELFINQVSTQFPRSKKLVHLHSQTLKFQHLGKLHFMKIH
jgi:hypothetical protein